MWEEVFNLAVNNGIWAVLFLLLLVYQLKDSKERENKYQKTISSLSCSLSSVEKINSTVSDTHTRVVKIEHGVDMVKTKVNANKSSKTTTAKKVMESF
jgi:hypothetical protein